MSFVPKETKRKVKAEYKTLYISQSLSEQVDDIAKAYNTSFNNVVISMIEKCLEEEKEN